MRKDDEKYLEKAAVLVEALPYIQKFNRKVIVVKYGGRGPGAPPCPWAC